MRFNQKQMNALISSHHHFSHHHHHPPLSPAAATPPHMQQRPLSQQSQRSTASSSQRQIDPTCSSSNPDFIEFVEMKRQQEVVRLAATRQFYADNDFPLPAYASEEQRWAAHVRAAQATQRPMTSYTQSIQGNDNNSYYDGGAAAPPVTPMPLSRRGFGPRGRGGGGGGGGGGPPRHYATENPYMRSMYANRDQALMFGGDTVDEGAMPLYDGTAEDGYNDNDHNGGGGGGEHDINVGVGVGPTGRVYGSAHERAVVQSALEW
jgi:hypothetical protein